MWAKKPWLIAFVVAVLVWVFLNNYTGPVSPAESVIIAALAFGITNAVFWVVRRVRSRKRSDEKRTH